MITKEMLEDWMMDNGEDVLIDGPFNLNESQMEEFVEITKNNPKIVKHLIKDGFIDDISEIEWDVLGVGSTDKSSKLILKEFVTFLNKEGLTL